jgi:cell division septum initiation protein DivIVA
VTDNRMKDRVKVMLGTTPDTETSEHALIAPNPGHPNQALQVLTMAQRTAEEHVATAHRQADKIRTDALAAAEEIAREAQVHAHNVRREADKVLFDARAAAEQTARDAQARTADARRNADKVVEDARAHAEKMAAEAQANVEELKLQAQRRYEDVVGSLGTKREALQQQIEALERFDREYRSRLTAFMQGQLRSLWVDQPQVAGELEIAEAETVEEPEPVEPVERQAPEAGAPAQQIPAQRQGSDAEPQPVGAHASAEE